MGFLNVKLCVSVNKLTLPPARRLVGLFSLLRCGKAVRSASKNHFALSGSGVRCFWPVRLDLNKRKALVFSLAEGVSRAQQHTMRKGADRVAVSVRVHLP
jgi:hypothetical protein